VRGATGGVDSVHVSSRRFVLLSFKTSKCGLKHKFYLLEPTPAPVHDQHDNDLAEAQPEPTDPLARLRALRGWPDLRPQRLPDAPVGRCHPHLRELVIGKD
jgi:hypothetical protein